jgi:penicillin-binding protein 1A
MRSDHWGQGGHNALLLVGDFFRDTLKTRRIDTKARFPQPERPPPLMVTAPLEEWIEQAQETMGALPPGHGVVTRHASGTTVVVGPDGVQTAERNRDTVGDDALGRFLNGIERGISSSGSNGRAGRSDSSDSFLESANDRLFPEVGN